MKIDFEEVPVHKSYAVKVITLSRCKQIAILKWKNKTIIN